MKRLHNIKRIKDINDKVFELLIAKKPLHIPVAGVIPIEVNGKIYKKIVASGTSEPWMRFIFDKSKDNNPVYKLTPAKRVRIDNDNITTSWDLVDINPRKSIFVMSDYMGVAPFYSYFSSLVHSKPLQVIYIANREDGINIEWLECNHKVLVKESIDKLYSHDIVKGSDYTYYIYGHKDSNDKMKHKLQTMSVKEEKIMTLEYT